jgi:hypothetical protein
MKNTKNIKWIIAGGLILAAALSRLLPHPYNFSPITAMALLGGAVMGKKAWAFILPVGALFLSDLCFQLFTTTPGFYGWGQLLNYGAFALVVVLGIMALRKINVKRVVFTSLAASVLFFMISNFSVWLFAGGIAPYTRDSAGLMNTFVLGIPFFGNTLIGDLVYSGVLFGAYSLIRHIVLSKKQVVA